MAQYPPITNQILKGPGYSQSGTTPVNIDFANSSFRGIVISYKASAITGSTPTIDVKLQGMDANRNYYDIYAAAMVQNTSADIANVYQLTVYPGLTNATTGKIKNQDGVLPANLRLVVTLGGTNPVATLGIAYTFLP